MNRLANIIKRQALYAAGPALFSINRPSQIRTFIGDDIPWLVERVRELHAALVDVYSVDGHYRNPSVLAEKALAGLEDKDD